VLLGGGAGGLTGGRLDLRGLLDGTCLGLQCGRALRGEHALAKTRHLRERCRLGRRRLP
jgi:hypothetical protein